MKKLFLVVALAIAACTPQPGAEINAYRQTFSAFERVSTDVLNVVAPYERAATRRSSYTAADCPGEENVVLTNDPYCYGIRHGFATIGDPPLVASYRNLIEVIARFNAIVAAYAEGVSFRIIKQDVDEFSSSVDFLGSQPGTAVAGVVDELTPVTQQAALIRDRRELLDFLADNYATVDQAFAQMAFLSGRLYGTVNSGTAVLTANNPSLRATLNPRRKEIRVVIANWTVLIEETREMLSGMEFALSNPENLEVRLRNLGDSTFEIFSGFAALEAQLAALGTGGAFE